MGGVLDSGKASSVGSSLRKSCPQRQLQCFEQREQNGFLPQRKQVASSCPAPRLERSNELKNKQVGAHSFGTALSARKTERSLALASRGMIGLEQPDRSPVLKARGESRGLGSGPTWCLEGAKKGRCISPSSCKLGMWLMTQRLRVTRSQKT